MNLKLDWATYQATKWACQKWHYSRKVPAGKLNRVGVWEDDLFVGVVLFGMGSGNSTRGEQYGLAKRFEVAELVRVALTKHKTTTSKIVSIATRIVIRHNPNLQLLVSFADMREGHIGTLYQACNWTYLGSKSTNDTYMINGQRWHPRSVSSRGGVKWAKSIDPNAHSVVGPPKHKYVYPISSKAKQWAKANSQPYPKRVSGVASDTSTNHVEEGGAIPTGTLLK